MSSNAVCAETTYTQYPAVETDRTERILHGFSRVRKDITGAEPMVFENSPIVLDSRVPIFMDDPKYDALGQVVISFASEQDPVAMIMQNCSATMVRDVEGYDNVLDRNIIFSAGHCFDDFNKDGIDFKFDNAIFITKYIDFRGGQQIFSSVVDNQTLIFEYDSKDTDLAVALLGEINLPDGMKTGVATVDYASSVGDLVSVSGYPADLVGLNIDRNCIITHNRASWLNSTCGVQKGASGSPLEVAPTNTDRIVFSSITSSFFREGKYKNLARHSNITSDFLDRVGYLQKIGDVILTSSPVDDISSPCLQVLASSGIKVRSGPGVDFNIAGENRVHGQMLYEFDQHGDWSKIMMADGRDGYIARHYDGEQLAQRVPCI